MVSRCQYHHLNQSTLHCGRCSVDGAIVVMNQSEAQRKGAKNGRSSINASSICSSYTNATSPSFSSNIKTETASPASMPHHHHSLLISRKKQHHQPQCHFTIILIQYLKTKTASPAPISLAIVLIQYQNSNSITSPNATPASFSSNVKTETASPAIMSLATVLIQYQDSNSISYTITTLPALSFSSPNGNRHLKQERQHCFRDIVCMVDPRELIAKYNRMTILSY